MMQPLSSKAWPAGLACWCCLGCRGHAAPPVNAACRAATQPAESTPPPAPLPPPPRSPRARRQFNLETGQACDGQADAAPSRWEAVVAAARPSREQALLLLHNTAMRTRRMAQMQARRTELLAVLHQTVGGAPRAARRTAAGLAGRPPGLGPGSGAGGGGGSPGGWLGLGAGGTPAGSGGPRGGGGGGFAAGEQGGAGWLRSSA